MKNKSKLSSLVIIALLLFNACAEPRKSLVYKTDFENFKIGNLADKPASIVRWQAGDSTVEIGERQESTSGKFLHLFEGANKSVTLEIPNPEDIVSLKFKARALKQPHFKFRVEAFSNNEWNEIYNGDKEIIAKNNVVSVSVDVNKKVSKFRFISSSDKMGAFIDDVAIYREAKSTIETVSSKQPVLPVLKLKEINKVVKIKIDVDGNLAPLRVASIDFNLNGTTNKGDIKKLQVYYSENSNQIEKENLFGDINTIEESFSISGNQQLKTGKNYFWLSATLNGDANLLHKIGANCLSINLSNGESIVPVRDSLSRPQRIGIALKQKNEENVHTYRIPGLATTNKGTLIGVYDNRYSQGADLQGDIDVGMSRSIDGGTTWEPMKPIMDMGEYGGKSQDENGIGDPSVLVDRSNNTIWVAGVWAHGHPGKRNWFASKQGIKPEATSQFVLVKSEDDGVTWSDPINITPQIKDKDWFLLLQGPGKGITLKDGTLVFPAQFKDKDEMPHSTIIYSKDHGKTWNIGTGAKSNTTEAQVVELNDGSLMLNMRDNRNRNSTDSLHGRSVSTTKDLGRTWIEHATSRKALQESTCMASLISFDHIEKGQILFFSNPNTTKGRTNITIKTSFDQGKTWPVENQLELFEDNGYGYSCMTVIDENHIGILYEGSAELYYEKVNINELF